MFRGKKKILALVLMSFSILFVATMKTASAADTIHVTTADNLVGAPGYYLLENDITLSGRGVTFRGHEGDYTLDLNGHKLEVAADSYLHARGDVVIKDSSESGAGYILGRNTSSTVQVGGKLSDDSVYLGNLAVESGTIIASTDTSVAVLVYNGSSATVNGGDIVALKEDKDFVAVYNYAGSTLTVNGGTIEAQTAAICNLGDVYMNGGTVYSAKRIAVVEGKNSTFELNDGVIKTDSDDQAVTLSDSGAKFAMNGGKISAIKSVTEDSRGGTGITLFRNSEFIMNDGLIESTDAAVMTNGSVESSNNTSINAKITIHGGTITSDNHAMYIPHINGVTTITGGNLISGTTAIEIRAGTLNISGGTFVGGDNYSVRLNDSGTTTKGAAIAVAQHNTKQPISVNICGGIFRAAVPFSETNPQGNAPEFTQTIEGYIGNSCSELRFESTGDKDVVSEDIEKFITGGLYTHDVADFVADGYGSIVEGDDGYAVYPIRRAQLVYFKNGNASLSARETLAGEPVSINAMPDDGYELADISVANSLGDPVEAAGDTYVAPDDDTFVWVVFRAASAPEPTPTPTPTPSPTPDPEPTPAPAPDKKDESTEPEKSSDSPRTNDDIEDYLTLFGVSLVVLVVIGIRRQMAKKSAL